MGRQVEVNIADNRVAVKYTRSENLLRVLWSLATPLFRLSPRPCFGWRRSLLRLFGARVGTGVNIYANAIIAMPWHLEVGPWAAIGEHAIIYNLGQITIGERATISQYAHLCAGTHDYLDPTMPLLKLPIVIGAQAWICAEAFVGPSVTVGEGAVVGARAVVTRNVPSWTVVAGNPAREIKTREMK